VTGEVLVYHYLDTRDSAGHLPLSILLSSSAQQVGWALCDLSTGRRGLMFIEVLD
jgi:hypothetical protein